jgi:hypothetical protein
MFDLLKKGVDLLPLRLQGLLMVLFGILFGSIAIGALRPDQDEKKIATAFLVVVAGALCLLFLWTGISAICGVPME